MNEEDTDRIIPLHVSPSESQPKAPAGMPNICAVCGDRGAHIKKRRCTYSAPLCNRCRALPEHRVMSKAFLRKNVPWLPAKFYPRPVGYTVNCRHPAFHQQAMYLWGDVAARCVDLGLEIPE